MVLLIILSVFILVFVLHFYTQNSKKVLEPETQEYLEYYGGVYTVKYPNNWIMAKQFDHEHEYEYEPFTIYNNKDVVFPGANSLMRNHDTIISINLSSVDCSTVIECINNPVYGLKNTPEGERRIKNTTEMEISGKKLLVTKLSNPGIVMSEGYLFVYNNAMYSIEITSGSHEQFVKDYKVFSNFINSFKIIVNTN